MAAKRPSQPFFQVGRVKFPFISSERFKQGDMELVELVTGKDWYEWCTLLKKHSLDHPQVRNGFFAIAVQRMRQATAEEVKSFIADLPLIDGVTLVFPDVPKKDGEGENPPAEDETAAT